MENEYNETDHPFVATDIPLDDQGVMSLFHDTSALGITPDDIGGCPVGCLSLIHIYNREFASKIQRTGKGIHVMFRGRGDEQIWQRYRSIV